ncbi:hypothetical protein BDM02DRAFT_3193125 [Thelephora ganbajun]|uniref:Uncharacterized protein n=1 Tax=Thelephora ganbajun TaxID=370292 RepID=A0ACB6YYW9_THEGA|nr:hypothetical protein BDM02DRAFT_3193125 [Thelephora ganbajun]
MKVMGLIPSIHLPPNHILLDMSSSICNKWYFRSYVPFLHSDTLWAVAIASFQSNVAHHTALHILQDPIVDILEWPLCWENAFSPYNEHHEARLHQVENQLHLLARSVDGLIHHHHGNVMALQHQVSELEARCMREDSDDDEAMLLGCPDWSPLPIEFR